MRRSFKIAVLLTLVLAIGCSQTPNNMSTDFYNDSLKVTKMLENRINTAENFTEKDNLMFDSYFANYYYKNKESLTEKEKKIVLSLFDVQNSYNIYKSTNDHNQKMSSVNNFEDQINSVKKELNLK